MEAENPKKFPVFFLIIGIIIILVFVFVAWRFGAQGFFSVLKWFLIILIFVAIIGLIVYAIIWLFKKHKKEMVYIMRKAIIQSCKVNKCSYPQQLFLLGSGKPFPQPRKLGKIVGFSMIKSAIKKMKEPETNTLIELAKPKDIIFCTFTTGGLSALFGDYEVFSGIYPDDFAGDLTASEVYIKDNGFGLSPKIYKMLWCSKHWHEKYIIDETSKETIHRLIVEDNLNDLKEIIEKGVNVEPARAPAVSQAQELGLDRAAKKKIGLS